MSRTRTSLYVILWLTISAPLVLAQQPAPPGLPPLFLREEWRQRDRPPDAAANFVLEAGVTPAAVTNSNLELRLYDPNAKSITGYAKQPPAGSIARDWGGPACIQLAGFNQNPPPAEVGFGARTDPANLWTGVCQTPVAATLRDKNNYVDLTGLARIRWVTRASGFHVVRPVVKLADGTWLIGDYAEGAPSSNSTLFLESEFAVASIRWLALDISRVVTRGQNWIEKPDLSRSTKSVSPISCQAAVTGGAASSTWGESRSTGNQSPDDNCSYELVYFVFSGKASSGPLVEVRDGYVDDSDAAGIDYPSC